MRLKPTLRHINLNQVWLKKDTAETITSFATVKHTHATSQTATSKISRRDQCFNMV